MKTKIYLMALVIASFAVSDGLAQEEDKKIRIKIIENVNGEKQVIERTYSSEEEMRNDPDLKSHDILLDKAKFQFKGEDGKHVIIRDLHPGEEGDESHVFLRHLDDSKHKDVHILRDGDYEVHQIDGNELTELKVDGDLFEFKKDEDGEVKIYKNGEAVESEFKFQSKHNDQDVFMLKSDDDQVKRVKVKIIKTIRVEDIDDGDLHFDALKLEDQAQLNLEGLSYYPNPSHGEINLKFRSEAKPTEIRLTDINGKIVYNDVMQDFSGNYDKSIDLRDQEGGIYILQIIQGEKAMNKKLIIN